MSYRQFWWQLRDLTLASIKSRYRGTFAGFVWVIFNPILMFGVQSLVFNKFVNLNIENYFLFLLGGLLPWIFITQTIQMGTATFSSSGSLLKAFKLNPIVLLCSLVLDNLLNFFASLLIILLPLLLYQGGELIGVFFLPLCLLVLLIGVFAFTFLLSTLNVFYRDTGFVVAFVMGLVFFITPVFYPKEFVPEGYKWLIEVNPFYALIEPFRIALYSFAPGPFFYSLGKAFIVALGSLGISTLYWKKKKNEFYFKL